jgi:succinate dehydrogenase flavin-adding protein (antitoxin of CptAB toxin-antitoxin module)
MSDSITAHYDRERDRQDKYVQSVKEKFEQRSQTGIKKYNTTLEREDLDFLDWLNHLQEELMDATLYIEKLKDFAQKTT